MEKKDNGNTTQREEFIELRSDNTRRFIKEEPPLFIRYGTVFIVLVLLMVTAILYFLKSEMVLNWNQLL